MSTAAENGAVATLGTSSERPVAKSVAAPREGRA
jgi:hypothetical protein